MIFTKKYEIGYKFLRYLAFKEEPVNLQTIATREQIDIHFLEQIARTLRLKGLVKSVRGPGGGYVLNDVSVNGKQLLFILDKNVAKNYPCATLLGSVLKGFEQHVIVRNREGKI